MAGWTSKAWQNLEAGGTPLNANGLIDTEDRLGAYVDRRAVYISLADFGLAPSNTAAENNDILSVGIDVISYIGGGCLYVPPGTYSFTGISAAVDDLHIIGAGPGASILRIVRTNQASPVVEAIRLIGDNLSISNLTLLEANQPATRAEHNLYPGFTGVRLGGMPHSPNNTYSDGVAVTNCEFQGIIGQAIVAYYTERAFIHGNRVANVGEGIAVENCTNDAIVSGNLVRDTSDDQIIVKCASDSGRAPGPTQRAVISGNICLQGDAKGIIAEGVEDCTMTGNVCRDHNQFGMAIHHDPGFPDLLPPQRVILANNVVQRAGGWYGSDDTKYLYTTPNNAAGGIKVEGPGFVTLNGNQVYDSYGEGIHLEGAGTWTDCAVLGNTVNGAARAGIVAGDPDGNTFVHSNVRVQNNDVSNSVGGIIAGELDIFSITGNVVHSYKHGASGSRRGIQLGHSQRGQVTGNTVVNDDGGDAQVYVYNGCVNVTSTPNVTL